MQPSNPGIVLPFYSSSEAPLQSFHDGYGILASDTNLINWSICVEDLSTPTEANAWFIRELNDDGSPVDPVSRGTQLPDNLITFAGSADKKWMYYNGGDIPGGVPCGTYEIIVRLQDVLYYSDAIVVKDLTTVLDKTRSVYKMTVSSSQHHNGILYGSGYQQVFYFLGQFAPTFEEEPELLDNGDGTQIVAHAQVRDRLAFLATNGPDSALSGLYEGKYHNVTIQRIAGGAPVTANRYDLTVSPVNDRNNVTITLDRATYITRYCEPEITLI